MYAPQHIRAIKKFQFRKVQLIPVAALLVAMYIGFQFRKVQLIHPSRSVYPQTYLVSIPQGPINTLINPTITIINE